MQHSFNSVTTTVVFFVLMLAVLCPLQLCATTPQLSSASITPASGRSGQALIRTESPYRRNVPDCDWIERDLE